MYQDSTLPPIGTRVVHKDNHKESSGPVWEVDGHNIIPTAPIRLGQAKHKLNEGNPQPHRHVSKQEFQDDYVQL